MKSKRVWWVGVLVKEVLYDKFVEVRRANDRVMSLAIVFNEVVRVVWAYAPQSGKSLEEKEFFMKIYQENGSLIT